MGIRNFKASQNAENTIIIPLFDHEGNPIISDISGKQAKIEVHGEDSRAYKKATIDLQSANLKIYQGTEKDTPAKQQNREIFLIKAIADGWSDVEDEGKELEFTPENLESVLRDEPYLIDKITNEIKDRSKFVKKSETTVLPTPKK